MTAGSENLIYRITGWGVIGVAAAATLLVWVVGFVVW